MANQIGFSNAMKEVVGNNFVTLNELKNDNEIYFPLFKNNANGTEAKKILGKLIANNSGGGSSTPSAQPDRVIIIDTTLTENIEGKAYKTFAEAKTYMESINDTYFQVELPAGNFNEQLICSDQWLLHGNNTIITTPVKTSVIASYEDEFAEIAKNEIGLQDCVITAGLQGESNSQTEIPIFRLFNCTLTGTIHNSMKIATFFSCGIDCETDTAEKTEMSYQLYASYMNCELKRVGKNFAALIYNSIVDYIIDCPRIRMFNCVTEYTRGMEGTPTIHCNYLHARCCSLNYPRIEFFGAENESSLVESCCFEPYSLNANTTNTHSIEFKSSYFRNRYVDGNFNKFMFHSCNVDFSGDHKDSGNESYPTIQLHNCTAKISDGSGVVTADSNSSVAYSGGTNTQLNAAANTVVTSGNYVTANHQPALYKYSTDGGSTMSDDPTGATHVGFLKNPNAVYSEAATVSDYIWVPLS